MWNNLTLKEKAELILAGVKAGYRDIDSIRKRFNSFSKGNYLEPIILRTQEQLPVENVENSDYSVVPKLDYYKDPNEDANKFDKGGKKSNFIDFITGHKEEKKQAAEEAAEWAKEYYLSEGFKERMKKLPHYYNQYRELYYPNLNHSVSFDYTLPEDPEFKYSNTKPSSYDTENDIITVGTRRNPEDYYKIINHELGHKYAKGVKTNIDTGEGTVTFEGGHYNYYPVFREGKQYLEALNNLTEADKRLFETYPESMAEEVHHDALPGENYADLISLRAELDKANIYDSNKSNNVFTKEHLDKAREYGITSRLFDNFDDDAIILMMNDVAHTTINDSGNNYAANGGRLFNKFDGGGNYTVGNLVDAIYLNNPKEEHLGRPSHLDDLTQSEEWANAHGYYPDAKGHRDDRVKKPAHPSHPSRGTWQGDNFILTDKGFEDPNYTLFGLNDGGQDPLATLIYDDGVVLPEITVTPNSKYINNSYDNIRLHLKSNGGKINRFDDGGLTLNTTKDPKEWIKDWYTDREDIWKNNQARIMLNDLTPEDRLYIEAQESPELYTSGIDSIKEIVIPNKAMDDYSIDLIGSPGIKAYNLGNGEVILSEDSYSKPEIRVHELIHGYDQEWRIPEMYIADILDTTEPQSVFLNTQQQDDYYFDDPKEIYARLMQFRNKADLDPKKVYNIEDVKKWRDSGKYKDEFLFDRYKDEFILKLLNEVADNQYPSNTHYANLGGHLKKNNKYLFGGLENLALPSDAPIELVSPNREDQYRYLVEKAKENSESDRRKTLMKNILNFTPILGTRLSINDAIDNPTQENIGWAGLDLISDIAWPLKILKVLKLPKAIDKGLTATSIFGDISKMDSDNGYGVMVPFGGEPGVSVGELPNVYITDRNLHGPEGQWSDVTEAGREKIELQKKVEKKVKEVFNPNFKNNYSLSNNKSNTTPSYTPSFGTSFFQVPFSQRKKWQKINNVKK